MTHITAPDIIRAVDSTPEQQALFSRIYQIVQQVPPGTVTTYGAVAQIVGTGCDARLVGYAMASLNKPDVPWQRVINAQGKISPRAGRGADIQRKRLEAEGIAFDERGRIDLDRFGWSGPDPEWAAQHGFHTLEHKDDTPKQAGLFD